MNPLPLKVGQKCVCDLCEGKYIQVDPVGCGCTECVTREYRPAESNEDYYAHREIGTQTP